MPIPVATKRAIWRIARVASLVVGLGFIAWLIGQILADPAELVPHVFTVGFLGAVVIATVSNAVVGILFSELVSKTSSVDRKKSYEAYYYAQIAKYIPGRITAILLQRSILASERALATVIVVNLEITGLCALLCSAAAVSMLLLDENLFLASVVAVISVLAVSFVMRLNWMTLVGRFKRLVLPTAPLPSSTAADMGVLQSALLSAGVFVLPALGNFVLLRYALGMDATTAVSFAAVLLLSWVGGLLAFVFPAGVGVRELLVIALGKVIIHEPATALMASVAISSRLAQVCADVLGVCAYFLAMKIFGKSGNEQ